MKLHDLRSGLRPGRPVCQRPGTIRLRACRLPQEAAFSSHWPQLEWHNCKLKSQVPHGSYEWVLKKKRMWGHNGGGCGDTGCTCGGGAIYPDQPGCSFRARVAMPLQQAAPQAAPVYGVGQHAYRTVRPAPTIASVPAEMTPALAGEEVPPAPEAPRTRAGLLLPTPSGN